MRIDLSLLSFAQEHLKDVDLNDSETTQGLKKTAYLENEGRQKSHDEKMVIFRNKMSKFCSSIQDLQGETIDFLEEIVSDLFEEAALYKAMALHIQVHLDVANRVIKERETKETLLHVVK